MDNNDGNGDGNVGGNPYVSTGTFNQYKADQASLCNAYRSHIETKITNMETNIMGRIKTFAVAVSAIVSLLTIINIYLQWRGII